MEKAKCALNTTRKWISKTWIKARKYIDSIVDVKKQSDRLKDKNFFEWTSEEKTTAIRVFAIG